MKIRFDKRVELAFLGIALLGIVGRAWVLPAITWQQQTLLFLMTLAMLNGVWVFHYTFDDWLNRRVPYEKGVRQRIIIQLVGGWTVVQSVLFLLSLLIFNRIIPTIGDSLNRLTLITLSAVVFLANVVISLGFITSHFFSQWQANVLRAARLEKEKAQVQYDNLTNQLNPHFLFNSLSSLDSLIEENPALARRFLQQLSKVYRYVLQHKDKELVSLETELCFIKNYVSLLETRFDGTFRISCQIDPDALKRQIVPVTLQILIENAIKHNVISEVRPLTVHITADSNFLTVSNPIQRKKQVSTSNGQGLQNVKMLYGYLITSPVEVQDDSETFRVRVPLLSSV